MQVRIIYFFKVFLVTRDHKWTNNDESYKKKKSNKKFRMLKCWCNVIFPFIFQFSYNADSEILNVPFKILWGDVSNDKTLDNPSNIQGR